jgi:hypothetical protein
VWVPSTAPALGTGIAYEDDGRTLDLTKAGASLTTLNYTLSADGSTFKAYIARQVMGAEPAQMEGQAIAHPLAAMRTEQAPTEGQAPANAAPAAGQRVHALQLRGLFKEVEVQGLFWKRKFRGLFASLRLGAAELNRPVAYSRIQAACGETALPPTQAGSYDAPGWWVQPLAADEPACPVGSLVLVCPLLPLDAAVTLRVTGLDRGVIEAPRTSAA